MDSDFLFLVSYFSYFCSFLLFQNYFKTIDVLSLTQNRGMVLVYYIDLISFVFL